MSFKVKNSQLSNETLAVLTKLIDEDINATSAFKLARVVKHISSIIEDKVKMEQKIREKWIARDDNGNPIVPKDDNGNPIEGHVTISDMNGFNKDMKQLMEVENEIPYDKVSFDDLEYGGTSKVSDMIKIEFLFS